MNNSVYGKKIKMLVNIETLTLQEKWENKKMALKPNFHTVKCIYDTFLMAMILDKCINFILFTCDESTI